MRRRWIYRDGEAIEVTQDWKADPVADHHVMPDIQPYQSMADGSMIMSRSQHREHLKRHGLVEIGNDTGYLKPGADLRKTGVKEALIDSVQRAKEQYGTRHVERAISESLQRAHEMGRRR